MKAKRRRPKRHNQNREDYREFLFTASGKDIDPRNLSQIDVYDNVAAELDRLKAIADLMNLCSDGLEPEILSGVGSIVKQIHGRMEKILDLSLDKKSQSRP